jgi:serine/threonine protein kinase
VWQATYKGAPVAAKVILTQQEENGTLFLRESSRERKVRSQFLKDFEKEMRMVCSLRHDHVATPIGFVAQAHKVVIVMEVMRYGSLYDLLHNETLEIDESMVVEILLDVALGMKFLHSQPIAHKYLSSNNVLLGRNLSAKVADFAYPRRGKNVVKNLRKALEDEKVLGSGGREVERQQTSRGLRRLWCIWRQKSSPAASPRARATCTPSACSPSKSWRKKTPFQISNAPS